MTVIDDIRVELAGAGMDAVPTERKIIGELLDQMIGIQTATIETDPNTFLSDRVFDLGHSTIATAKLTILNLNGDGETLGSSIVIFGRAQEQSFDGTNFVNATTYAHYPYLGITELDGEMHFTMVTARYFKLRVAIYDQDSNDYTGPNHPVVTVKIDLEYL